jgi:acyl carrier protein
MEKVIGILKEIRPEFEFAGVEDFFADGLLDSLDLTMLISRLEETYGIAIKGADIVPENFHNLDTIVRLVKGYGGQP